MTRIHTIQYNNNRFFSLANPLRTTILFILSYCKFFLIASAVSLPLSLSVTPNNHRTQSVKHTQHPFIHTYTTGSDQRTHCVLCCYTRGWSVGVEGASFPASSREGRADGRNGWSSFLLRRLLSRTLIIIMAEYFNYCGFPDSEESCVANTLLHSLIHHTTPIKSDHNNLMRGGGDTRGAHQLSYAPSVTNDGEIFIRLDNSKDHAYTEVCARAQPFPTQNTPRTNALPPTDIRKLNNNGTSSDQVDERVTESFSLLCLYNTHTLPSSPPLPSPPASPICLNAAVVVVDLVVAGWVN